MGPVDAVKTCLRKYASFSGRASRSEFGWFAALIIGGSLIIFWTIDIAVRGRGLTSLFVMLAFQIGLLVPFLAAIWRRCHDRGLRGVVGMTPFFILATGVLISFVEAQFSHADLAGLFGVLLAYGGFLLTGIPLLVWLLLPSTPGPNPYGPNPNEVPT